MAQHSVQGSRFKQTRLESEFVRLAHKPSAQLSFAFAPREGRSSEEESLIVFLSPLDAPIKVWMASFSHLRRIRANKGWPAMLFYDRFGCGQSEKDPSDIGKKVEEYHDLPSAVHDLRELINDIASKRLGIQPQDVDKLRLFLVGNSIGGVIARMYAQTYPRTVFGMVLMDCAPSIRNSQQLIPDPDAADFQSSTLPDGVTVELLRASRAHYAKSIFNPLRHNKECLNWRNLIIQLPVPSGPKLVAPDGEGPFLTIIKHDPVVMAKQYKQVSCSPLFDNSILS